MRRILLPVLMLMSTALVAAEWSKGKHVSKFPKEMMVLDVRDQTAMARVVAEWGQDYLLLGKFDGQWKITQVLWQSLPAGR